jgi:hypothetical protein
MTSNIKTQGRCAVSSRIVRWNAVFGAADSTGSISTNRVSGAIQNLANRYPQAQVVAFRKQIQFL